MQTTAAKQTRSPRRNPPNNEGKRRPQLLNTNHRRRLDDLSSTTSGYVGWVARREVSGGRHEQIGPPGIATLLPRQQSKGILRAVGDRELSFSLATNIAALKAGSPRHIGDQAKRLFGGLPDGYQGLSNFRLPWKRMTEDENRQNFLICSKPFEVKGPEWRSAIPLVLDKLFPEGEPLLFEKISSHVLSVQSTPEFTVGDCAQIYQAVIWFEPVLDIIFDCQAEEIARNWQDNPLLGAKTPKQDRLKSLTLIEDLELPTFRASTGYGVVDLQDLVQSQYGREPNHPLVYRVNMNAQLPPCRAPQNRHLEPWYHQWITFRGRPIGDSGQKLVDWIDFIIFFIKAAIACEHPLRDLPTYEPTFYGLRRFLAG